MSLQQAYPGAPVQTKLFEPNLLAYAERLRAYLSTQTLALDERLLALRPGLLRLLALAQQHRMRLFVSVAAFFVVGAGAFAVSLLRVAPAAASSPAVAAARAPRPLELHIAENGLILLRSARITAINGSALTLSTVWGSTQFTWVAQTDAMHYETRNFGTKFLNREGKAAALSNFHIGDLVTVTGTLDPDATEPTLKADTVRLVQ
jgi:hypothetical protein